MSYSYYTSVDRLLGEGTAEKVLATATKILINQNKLNEAVLLLSSDLALETEVNDYNDEIFATTSYEGEKFKSEEVHLFIACLLIPVDLYSGLDNEQELLQSIEKTIETILPPLNGYRYRSKLLSFQVKPQYLNVKQEWREELVKFIEEEKALNQATFIKNENQVFLWNGIRFASLPEMEIAKQLEKIANLLYIPNCLTRLIGDSARRQLIPDFLVKYNGQWAILEIDGSQHNLPTQAERDKERDRVMLNFGLPTVRFSARRCTEDAEKVVLEFLQTIKGWKN